MQPQTPTTPTTTELQKTFVVDAENYLKLRASDNPEFKKEFIKTFSDLLFSQNEEMLEKLSKTKPASLLNAVFKATEVGASFAKKEVSFIPYEIFKKESKNGVDKKVGTNEFEALVIFDINFQKQQILKLKNCKRFFTAEIHDGMKILSDLSTGNFVFEGENDVMKPTVGYYASFTASDNERYDLFMSCSEIVERAKFSPQYKEANYKNPSNSIHYEKIVVRNLMKIIPKISGELSSIIAYDEAPTYTTYEDVTEKPNALEAAKKELAGNKAEEKTAKTEKVVEKAVELAPTETPASAPLEKVEFDGTFF